MNSFSSRVLYAPVSTPLLPFSLCRMWGKDANAFIKNMFWDLGDHSGSHKMTAISPPKAARPAARIALPLRRHGTPNFQKNVQIKRTFSPPPACPTLPHPPNFSLAGTNYKKSAVATSPPLLGTPVLSRRAIKLPRFHNGSSGTENKIKGSKTNKLRRTWSKGAGACLKKLSRGTPKNRNRCSLYPNNSTLPILLACRSFMARDQFLVWTVDRKPPPSPHERAR